MKYLMLGLIILFSLFSNASAYPNVYLVGDSIFGTIRTYVLSNEIRWFSTSPGDFTEYGGKRLVDDWQKGGTSSPTYYWGYNHIIDAKPEVVVVFLGINDLVNKYTADYAPNYDIATIVAAFSAFYDDLRDDLFNPQIIQVLSHPMSITTPDNHGSLTASEDDCNTGPWCWATFNPNYAEFVSQMLTMCATKNVQVANVWQWVIDNYPDTDDFAAAYLDTDGVHPVDSNTTYWEDVLKPLILEQLKKPLLKVHGNITKGVIPR